jgi:hypothetical protein
MATHCVRLTISDSVPVSPDAGARVAAIGDQTLCRPLVQRRYQEPKTTSALEAAPIGAAICPVCAPRRSSPCRLQSVQAAAPSGCPAGVGITAGQTAPHGRGGTVGASMPARLRSDLLDEVHALKESFAEIGNTPKGLRAAHHGRRGLAHNLGPDETNPLQRCQQIVQGVTQLQPLSRSLKLSRVQIAIPF